MNDEIRKILDYMKKESNYKHLSFNASKLLLDYITNLQQENEDYKSRVEKAVELIKNKLSFETYQHLKKLYDDIDSIEEIWEDYEFKDLLNILQNGSDDNG